VRLPSYQQRPGVAIKVNAAEKAACGARHMLARACTLLPLQVASVATRAGASPVSRGSSSPQRLCVIDGTHLMYRLHFALPPLSTAAGTPTHAVLGFCNKLLYLSSQFQGHAFAVAMDHAGQTQRHALLPEYKAQRKSMPADLRSQIDLLSEACEAFDIPILSEAGYEADDLCATAAAAATAARAERVVIITSDKDLLQLVSTSSEAPTEVVVYDDVKKQLMEASQIEQRFAVRPDQLGDYLAMVGDASDNIAGVPGIGPKTAAKLLAQHGDLESVLAAAPGMAKSKRREALIAHADQARLARRLVALQADVPVRDPLLLRGALMRPPSELPLLRPFLQLYELRSLEKKLGFATSTRSHSKPH